MILAGEHTVYTAIDAIYNFVRHFSIYLEFWTILTHAKYNYDDKNKRFRM